ncbi:MAG TPA: metallophosphoesterase [Gaiellaceae bacterium]|jgi:Icc-related predicted phosphoesterase
MTIRVAAAGDIHCSEEERSRLETAFMDAERESDLILLAGDLTTYGEPEQAAVLADVTRGIGVPVFAVLGNHDWHANRHEELVSALRGGGIRVLERAAEVVTVNGLELGIVGTKGFIGGFTGSLLPDFGEPLLRRVYAETSAEVSALDRGLRRVCDCPVRIVLLHYAPTATTIQGEPETIWTYLGSERLAEPIAEHKPDLVLHGHGHGGSFAGHIDSVPVFNVGVPVIGRDFWIFELDEQGLAAEPAQDSHAAERA